MRACVSLLTVVLASGSFVSALETDQYYAWGRPLADSTEVLNAKVNLEIGIALERINRSRTSRHMSCETVVTKLTSHFRMLIFHPIELWASNSSLVARIPSAPDEELAYPRASLYGIHGPLDVGTWLPPAPTIQLNGVRVGTDKLAHFFSGGRAYYLFYRRVRRWGLDREQAEIRTIDRGIFSEKTYLGKASSGVFSAADLEANFQGMRFLRGFCEGDAPRLRQEADGWAFSRPFDFRDYVTVEWDESYNHSAFSPLRWKKVRPRLLGYCAKLDDPSVRERRRAYAARDGQSVTERRIRELIAAGELPDPDVFSIEEVCAANEGSTARVEQRE